MNLPAASVLLALLEADAVLVGQWMFSRPILLGPLMGLACGQFSLGVGLGVLNELLSLDEKPLGSIIPLNASVAAGCAVLMCAGPYSIPAEISFPAGLSLGLGHKWMESAIRKRRAVLTRIAERGLRENFRVPWSRILTWSVGAHIAATAAFIYASVLLVSPALAWSWAKSPAPLKGAASGAFSMVPWIGLATMIHALARRG